MSRTVIRAVAVFLLVAAFVIWLATGAHAGWTKTSVPVQRTDEVTGLTVDRLDQDQCAGPAHGRSYRPYGG